MKKNDLTDKTLLGATPCGVLFDRIGSKVKTWTSFHSELLKCLIESNESKGSVLDPFALLAVTANIRSNAELSGEIGNEILQQAENWAQQSARDATIAFDADIRSLCSKENIVVSGRFPSYVLDGFLNLRLSPNERKCTVGDRKLPTLMPVVVWEQVRATIQQERLRSIEPNEFLSLLLASYMRMAALHGVKPGSPVSIKGLLRELIIARQSEKFWKAPQRLNFAEYSEEYFCRDLAKLISAGRFVTPNGQRLELIPTAFAKDGLAIIVGEGVRYFGHVNFEAAIQ